MLTNARAVDVDDVILNTTGAALAFGLFWVLARLLRRSGKASELLERLGASANREPLLLPAVPILVTAVIAVPIMVLMIVAATLGDGPSGILGHATADWPGGTVGCRPARVPSDPRRCRRFGAPRSALERDRRRVPGRGVVVVPQRGNHRMGPPAKKR